MTTRNDLSPLFWLWLPLTSLAVFATIVFFFPHLAPAWIESENGLVELGTVILLLPAIVSGFMTCAGETRLPSSRLTLWLFLVTLACVYIAGEEISWGQHLLGWETPEPLQAINDQRETNLHNISSWFDQKPRLLLELWILAGGIFLPLRNSLSGIRYQTNDWRYWFWPSAILLPTGLLAILVKFPERLENLFGWWPYDFHVRYSELQEFYFAMFLMLYVLSIRKRLMSPGTRDRTLA